MPAVVAISPLTSTCDPAPNNTPLGLRMRIFPLALKCPKIWLGLPLLIRLSVIADDDGCMKSVVSFGAISKPRQSITALFVVCVMSSTLPEELIVAAPAATVPPVGLANPGVASTEIIDKKTAAQKTLFLIKKLMSLGRPSPITTRPLNFH